MRSPPVVASLRGTSYIGMPGHIFSLGPRMNRLLVCLLMLSILFVQPQPNAGGGGGGESTRQQEEDAGRRQRLAQAYVAAHRRRER